MARIDSRGFTRLTKEVYNTSYSQLPPSDLWTQKTRNSLKDPSSSLLNLLVYFVFVGYASTLTVNRLFNPHIVSPFSIIIIHSLIASFESCRPMGVYGGVR